MRNKILKFGAQAAVSQGDLVIGYVTNISKAGCFVSEVWLLRGDGL